MTQDDSPDRRIGDMIARMDRLPPYEHIAPPGCWFSYCGGLKSADAAAARAVLEGRADGPGQPNTAPLPQVTQGEHFFEVANLIETIERAGADYTIVELGGGTAARAVDAAGLSRRFGRPPPRVVVAEPVAAYMELARLNLDLNGVPVDRRILYGCAVGGDNRPQFMPISAQNYGNTFLSEVTSAQRFVTVPDLATAQAVIVQLIDHGRMTIQTAEGIGDHGFVSCLTIAEILAPFDFVDYVDIDIQSAEVQAIAPAMDALTARAGRVHVGIHRAAYNGVLRQMFEAHGWTVLHDYLPNRRHETAFGAFTCIDGLITAENVELLRRRGLIGP